MAPTAVDRVEQTILSAVAAGTSTSRAALAKQLGLAASTVSMHVSALIQSGQLSETGEATPTGGRKARQLSIVGADRAVLGIELGTKHARGAICGMDGKPGEHRLQLQMDITEPPSRVLAMVIDAGLGQAERAGCQIAAIGLALPGPVNADTGTVILPSRMPGWKDFPVRDWAQNHYHLPIVVDNDANLMAYGEHILRGAGLADTVTVKAGAGIGAGVIVGGHIHRGGSFSAGDITHVRVPAAGDRPCSCGNLGCLETIASGTAIVSDLRAQGLQIADTTELLALADKADPQTTTAIRAAGSQLGQVLCAVTNFFNPAAIYLGGALSQSESFVAAVRSMIYQGSHPLATEALVIEPTRGGADATLLGAARLAVLEAFRHPSETAA